MSRKKVILYNPLSVFFDMPLALLAVGSALDSSEYEAIIIDARIEKNVKEALDRHLPDAICFGVTVLTGKPLRDALETTKWVKQKYPGLCTVWGGWHPSLFPKETLEQEKSIDITVQGQGELTFQEIVKACDSDRNFAAIKGITYRNEENIIQNPARVLVDMNTLPRINYDLIPVETYYQLKGKRQFDYISSTGCNFRCTFCADPFVFGRSWTGIEPERMIEEFTYWNQKYPFDDVNFQDETFFTHKKRTLAFAQGLIDSNLKISWAGTLRADQCSRLTEEEFTVIVKSGLRRVLIGVESGTQEMLNWLKKDIKLTQVYEAADRCKKFNVAVNFPFIVGFPNETDESIKASLSVAQYLHSLHPKFSTPIFYFKPYPGSGITQEVVNQGYQLPTSLEEWSDFDFVGGVSGPWVKPEIYELVENFKFYNMMAYRKHNWITYPLQLSSKIRMKSWSFQFPFEKHIVQTLYKKPSLS
ncbi:MAG: B12-binding domain-containing radical SAM protein [Bacteroidia bacterium]|nr:B12-binding domain-containing radical SAM protein [Bacteroidia bacterium]